MAKLIVYFACLFVKIATEAASLPIIPYYVINGLSGDSFDLGILLSIYALAQVCGAVFFGYLSDCYGRKNALVLSTIINAIGFYFTCKNHLFSSSIRFFIICRSLIGFSSVCVPLSEAVLADFSGPKLLPKLNSKFSILIGVATAVGPLLGGVGMYWFEDRATCFGISFVGAIAFLILVCVLIDEEFLAGGMKRRKAENWGGVHRGIEKPLLLGTGFWLVCLARLITSFCVTVMGACYYLLLLERYRFDIPDLQLARILALSGLFSILYQHFVFGRLCDILGSCGALSLGCSVLSLGIFVVWRSTYFPLWVHLTLLCLVYSLAYSIIDPGFSTVASECACPENQGISHGLITGSRFLGSTLSPLAFGKLYSMNPKYPFLLASSVACIPVLLLTYYAAH